MNGAFDSFCYKPPDMDILIAAALWHDVMKVEEYERSETAAVSGIMWRHTDTYSKRIG
jgi:23S rRNA maturation-related 3'-5' exoribonuclease YhaM